MTLLLHSLKRKPKWANKNNRYKTVCIDTDMHFRFSIASHLEDMTLKDWLTLAANERIERSIPRRVLELKEKEFLKAQG